MLELAAIWIIVILTFVWFFRDEKRRNEARVESMVAAYATAPHWRHRPAAPIELPVATRGASQGGLTHAQRKFFQQMQQRP